MKFGYLEYFSMFFSYKELYMTNTIHCIHWLGFNRKENKKTLVPKNVQLSKKKKVFSKLGEKYEPTKKFSLKNFINIF